MKKLLIPFIVGSGLICGTANAASTNYWFSGEDTLLSDNSAEFLINADGTPDNTILEIGDSLSGIFNIGTREPVITGGEQDISAAEGFNELSGIFQILVTGKVADGAGGWDFTFGVDPIFASTYGAGAMVAFFDDENYEYSRLNDSIANLENNVTNGNLLMVAGFDGGANEFWTSNAITDDLAIVGAIPLPNNGGVFNIGIDLLINNTGQTFNAISCFEPNNLFLTSVDMCGSGSLLGISGANTPYDTFDNVDFVMSAAVPEPGVMLMLGSGFLVWGAGVAARRRKKS